MAFFTSVVFYCLPLLYNDSAILPSSHDAASKAYVHGIVSQFAAAANRLGVSGEDIKIACEDYQLCKDTVNVSQSEIGQIKEKLEISKGEQEGGGDDVDTCDTEHVVNMHKKMLECNMIFVEEVKRFRSEGQANMTAMRSWCKRIGVSLNDWSTCKKYKYNDPIFSVDEVDCQRILDFEYLAKHPKQAEEFFVGAKHATLEGEQFKRAFFTQSVIGTNGAITSREFNYCLLVRIAFLKKHITTL